VMEPSAWSPVRLMQVPGAGSVAFGGTVPQVPTGSLVFGPKQSRWPWALSTRPV
jgi:hypothetical protein